MQFLDKIYAIQTSLLAGLSYFKFIILLFKVNKRFDGGISAHIYYSNLGQEPKFNPHGTSKTTATAKREVLKTHPVPQVNYYLATLIVHYSLDKSRDILRLYIGWHAPAARDNDPGLVLKRV